MILTEVCGIIAEFDPFHLGHAHLIREARRLTGCDYVVVALSTAFVQRGTPGMFSTRDRTLMALRGGADAVFALPAAFSCAPADRFALGGVAVLDGLGAVTSLAFGCEDAGAADRLSAAAGCIEENGEAFRDALRGALERGLPYPAAQAAAVAAVTGLPAGMLSAPNNILAIAYLRQLRALGSPIRPCPVQRIGRRDGTSEGFQPSSALRTLALDRSAEAWARHVPESSAAIMRDALGEGRFCPPEALTQALLYRLYSTSPDCWRRCAWSDEGVEGRLEKALRRHPASMEELLALLKTRRYTRAALRRWLSRILLDMPPADDPPAPACLRLLGFRTAARPLLRMIRRQAALPVITRPAEEKALLASDARAELLWSLGAGRPASLYTQSPVVL